MRYCTIAAAASHFGELHQSVARSLLAMLARHSGPIRSHLRPAALTPLLPPLHAFCNFFLAALLFLLFLPFGAGTSSAGTSADPWRPQGWARRAG